MDLTPDEIRLIEEHRRKHPPPIWEPRAASDYSLVGKCMRFDRLHAMALEHFHKVRREQRADENDAHYMFEAVIELLGNDVWTTYNKFLK